LNRPDDGRPQARLPAFVLSHFGGIREDFRRVIKPCQFAQCLDGPLRRFRLSAKTSRLPQNFRAVSSFQADAPAHSGDGIDNKPNLFQKIRPLAKALRRQDRKGKSPSFITQIFNKTVVDVLVSRNRAAVFV
jgi:hypothetical protein